MAIAPEIAVGDGALGFWKALDEVWPGTRHQRCWVGLLNNPFFRSEEPLAGRSVTFDIARDDQVVDAAVRRHAGVHRNSSKDPKNASRAAASRFRLTAAAVR